MMKRYNSIDLLKFLCSFMVIYIHANIKNQFGSYLYSFCRIAVPIFFMISGYFLYNSDSKTWSKIKKNLNLLIFSEIFYIFFEIIKIPFKKSSFTLIFNNLFNFKFLLTNIGEIGGHLWFVRALIYVYIIHAVLKKLKISEKKILILCMVISIVDPFLFKYLPVILSKSFNIDIAEPFSKFIGTAFVSFYLGYFSNIYFNFNKKTNIFLCCMLFALNILEILIMNDKNQLFNFITTIPFAFSVFLVFKNLNIRENLFSKIGKLYSGDIYIYHIFILSILNIIFANYFNIYMYFRALLVMVFTIFFVVIIRNIKKRRCEKYV